MRMKLMAAVAMGVSCLAGSAAMAQDAAQADTNPPAAPPAETSPPAAPPPEASPPAAPAAEASPPAAPIAPAFVPKGTPIVIEITDLVSSKTAKRDDMFNLKLAEPIMLNGAVAIPAGTPGKGQVVDAAKPGMGGKPGKLVLAVRYLEFGGQQIPIHGLKLDMAGKDNSDTAVAVAMAAGMIGLAVQGGQMEVQPGTQAHAKLGVDFTPVSEPAPQPAVPDSAAIPPTDTGTAPAESNTTADPAATPQNNP